MQRPMVFIESTQRLVFLGLAKELGEDVDGLEVVGDLTAGGQVQLTFLQETERVGQLHIAELAPAHHLQQEGLGLEQEGAVVADVVDDVEGLLAGGFSQAPPELLQPEHPGLGWAQHHDGVDLGQVEAFVEHVHTADDVELSLAQFLKRSGSGRAVGSGVDGDGSQAVMTEVGSHEVGVGLGAAEGYGAAAAVLVVLFEGVGGAALGGHGAGEGFGVEA